MSKELVRASELQMPSCSGTVSVPLAELDNMRAQHAKAVQVAKDLDEKQAMVKLVVTMQELDRNGYKLDKKTEKIEYKGFEDFRANIAEEERKKLHDEIKSAHDSADTAWKNESNMHSQLLGTAKQRDAAVQKAQDLSGELGVANSNLKLAETQIETAIKVRENLEKQLIDLKEKYETDTVELNNRLTVANGRIKVIIHKQSFWYWIWKRFEPKTQQAK